MDAGTITALAAAGSALFGGAAAFGKLHSDTATLKAQQQQLESQRRKDAADWQVQLLRELTVRRMEAYPDVFRALGCVIYVGDRQEVATDADLRKAADSLLSHLYGEAGVLMSPDARAAVHTARVACDEYLECRRAERDDKLVELNDAFWDARRQLRLDVQGLDLSLQNIVSGIQSERAAKLPSKRR
jgi:hypothetical protein